MKYYSLTYLAFLMILLSTSVCNFIGENTPPSVVLPTHNGENTPPSVVLPTHNGENTPPSVVLSTHDHPLATNYGETEIVFTLIMEDGCLRGKGQETVNFPEPSPILLVWPSGYHASIEEGIVRVKDAAGEVVAYSGAEVRFSGRFSRSESDLGKKLAADNPEICSGPYYLVGDEISVISPEESLVFKDPDSGLNFQRWASWRWAGERTFTPEYRRARFSVALKDDCLVAQLTHEGVSSEYEIVWPAGFYPYVGEDGVEVRNGGGKTIARPGERILVSGGYRWSPKPPYGSSECTEEVIMIDRIIDHGLPLAFLQHDAHKSKDEVLWDGVDYNRRLWDDEFNAAHVLGRLDRDSSCMHIIRDVLVWPANFSLDDSRDEFAVLDGEGNVVAREGETVPLRVRKVSFQDEEGLRILPDTPAGCDSGRFLLVGG